MEKTRIVFKLSILLTCSLFIKGDEEVSFPLDRKGTPEDDSLRECECWKWPQCVSNCSSNPLLNSLLASEHQHLGKVPTPFAIVFPYQTRKNRAMYNTSTLSKRGSYFLSTRFWFHLLNRRAVQLRIEKSSIFSKESKFSSLFFRKRGGKLSEVESDITKIKQCQYTGEVKSEDLNIIKNSYVAVDTCNGIRGILTLDDQTYGIAPINCPNCALSAPHVVFLQPEQPIDRDILSNTFWRATDFSPAGGIFSSQLLPPAVDDTFVIRVGVVIDKKLFNLCDNDVEKSVEYASRIVNLATKSFHGTQIDIELVHVEVWNLHNLASVSQDIKTSLISIIEHRLPGWKTAHMTISRSSRQTNDPDDMIPVPSVIDQGPRAKIDVTLLLSSQLFTDKVEYLTPPDSVCTPRATGVVQVLNIHDEYHVSRLVSLVIAEQLGIKSFSCPDLYKCDSTRVFSHGDKSRLKMALLSGIAHCLMQKPGMPDHQETCGDGKIDRGEECDMGFHGSGGEGTGGIMEGGQRGCCMVNVCLAASWARCVGGPCCRNCSLIAQGNICRPAKDECDLPEFCSGDKGSCPLDIYFENGQPCRGGRARCYQGRCPSLSAQCELVWGRKSHVANKDCYRIYNLGSKNSCGQEKCVESDVMCGVLHCENGEDKPLGGLTGGQFFTNNIHKNDGEIKCKSMADSPDRYVRDGTQCGPDRFCFGHRCVSITQEIKTNCPMGIQDTTSPPPPLAPVPCSNRGICTSLGRCLCPPEWSGDACQFQSNSSDTSYIFMYIRALKDEMLYEPMYTDDFYPSNKTPHLTTGSLIIILGSVIGCVFIFLTLFMICYRRRSSAQIKKSSGGCELSLRMPCTPGMPGVGTSAQGLLSSNASSIIMMNGSRRGTACGPNSNSLFSSRSSSVDDAYEDDIDNNQRTLISFGNMPTYQREEDRLNNAGSLTSSLHKGRTSPGTQSTSSSDIQSNHQRMDQSWKQPERGILKKKSSMNQTGMESDHLLNQFCGSDPDLASSHSSLSSCGSSSIMSSLRGPAPPPVVLCNASNQTEPPPLFTPPSTNERCSPPAPPVPTVPPPSVPPSMGTISTNNNSSASYPSISRLHPNQQDDIEMEECQDTDCEECKAAENSNFNGWTNGSGVDVSASNHYHSTDVLESTSHYYSTTLALGGHCPQIFNGGSPSIQIKNGHSLSCYDEMRQGSGVVDASGAYMVSSPQLVSKVSPSPTTQHSLHHPPPNSYPLVSNIPPRAHHYPGPSPSMTVSNSMNSSTPIKNIQQRPLPATNPSYHPTKQIGPNTSHLSSTASALLANPDPPSRLPTAQLLRQHNRSYLDHEETPSEITISAYRRHDPHSNDDYHDDVASVSEMCPSEVRSNDGTCDESDTSSLPDLCADLIHLANLGHSGRPNPLLDDLTRHQGHQPRRFHRSNDNSKIPSNHGRLSPQLPPPPSVMRMANNNGHAAKQLTNHNLDSIPMSMDDFDLDGSAAALLRRMSYSKATDSYESLDSAGR